MLAVDASARPTVALLGPEGEPWGQWTQQPGVRGTAQMAVQAESLLQARQLQVADLGGVVVGIGPGSYTGLRAAIAFARGLSFPHAIPFAGVVSVEAAALGVLRRGVLPAEAAVPVDGTPSAANDIQHVTVVLDARRDECYRADYQRDGQWLLETAQPCLVPASEITELESGLAKSGSSQIVVREPHPEGYDVAALGRRRLSAGGDDPATVLPLYLKRSHAEIALEERARRR